MKTYLLPFLLVIISLASCSKIETAEVEDLYESTSLVIMTSPEEGLFNLVNEHRIATGLPKLSFSAEAYTYAEEHNSYMIAQGELSHDNFSSRASKIAAETEAVYVGENVARNFTSNNATLNGWLNSSAHRKTIEGNFTHAAVSIVTDGNGNPYYTQIFFRK